MRRTPRSYSGTGRTNHELKDVLGSLLPEVERSVADRAPAVYEEWKRVVGDKMAPFTEPVSLVRGTLTVKVKGSTLYSVLMSEKGRLLGELQRNFPHVQTLVFRV